MPNDVVKFMDNINTIIVFIENALKRDDISNIKIEDYGDSLAFIITRGERDVVIENIEKYDEDTLRVIYLSIADHFRGRMEIGATSIFTEKNVIWNLAPVIDNKVLVEFISGDEKDQKWFFEEINEGTKQKGLR